MQAGAFVKGICKFTYHSQGSLSERVVPLVYIDKVSNLAFESIAVDVDVMCNANEVYVSGFVGVIGKR